MLVETFEILTMKHCGELRFYNDMLDLNVRERDFVF